ncbi:MAG: hypothetical protein ABSG97_04955 [Sedimentisphaerales bacterium]
MNTQSRHFVYPIWLRFFTLVAAFAAFVMFVGPSYLFSNSDASLPWNEQVSILPPGKTPQFKLSAEQPQLTGALRYKAQVEQGGQPRGDINVLIYPDGTVKGIWNGEYDQPNDVHRVILAANFTGNIDPSKGFLKGDPSKLYFVTAGTSTLMETNLSTSENHAINGFIYVRGWLDLNYAVVGELIITENKKTFESFSWVGLPVD